jgi:hypothetical protein
LLLLHTPCCTQDQLIYSSHFVFFSSKPLVVVGANGVVFFSFFLLVVVDSPLLFVGQWSDRGITFWTY